MKLSRWILYALLAVLCVGITLGQAACPEIVQSALSSLDKFCQSLERNQACYGNVSIEIQAQPDAASFKFEQVGDIVDVAGIRSLKLSPLIETEDKWGVAIMKLQADIPNALPGQNVTFVMFGDVEIQTAVDPSNASQTPMQAFYLTTGIGDAPCNEAPQSGMLVQTPKGIGEVSFNVNGVDVQMGSTVLFQAYPGDEFEAKTLQGSAALTINNKTYPVVAGTEFKALLDDDLTLDEDGISIQAYDLSEVEGLPLNALEELVGIADPLTPEEIADVLNKWANGEALCSDEANSVNHES